MREDIEANSAVFEAPSSLPFALWPPYREIGLAAVAIELDLLGDDLGEELEDAIERGARYIASAALALAS